MTETRRPLASLDVIIVAVVGLVFLAGFVAYMWKLHPLAAFMDTLRYLGYYDDSISGRHSIWLTWNQGQHRGLLMQALVYLNARFFHFSIFGCTMLSGAFIGLTGFAICLEMARSDMSRMMLTVLSVLTFSALFSLSNWELYSLDIGAALFAKNLSFLLYWIALDRAIRMRSRHALALCIVTAPLIVLLVAYGWSYAFVGASIFVALAAAWKTAEMRRVSLICAALIASMVLYVSFGASFPATRLAPEASATATNLWHLVSGTVLAVASIFISRESITVYGIPFPLLTLAGVTMLAAACYVLLGNLVIRRRDSIVPSSLIVYGLLDAASVAIARGMLDPQQAMASRYFEDLSLLIVGVAWSVALLARDVPVQRPAAVVTAALAVLFFVGQGATVVDEWNKVPYRHDSFARMAAVTVIGPKTLDDASLLQQPLDLAVRASAIQKKYDLGPFRHIDCETGPVIAGAGWYANDGSGSSWMGQSASVVLRNCGSAVHVRAYLPETFPGRAATLAIDGKRVRSFDIIPGHVEDLVVPAASTNRYVTIEITVDRTTVPAKAIPNSQDGRELGLLVSNVRSTSQVP
ncbi:hypothetical protein [Paraburkholderia sp.]|uniref:hypothetical protein n=1 Tax=Paraburkholderia sp. TaxID=1926495 RepID=UPI0025EB72E3|nr:hypothetical protein [Paraburkholderia sp.]